MQSVTIGGNQAGQRLDKYLRKYLPQAGSSFLYKMLRKKNITLNGKKAEGSEILCEGDEVRFFFAEETFEKFSGRKGSASEPNAEYERAYKSLKGIEILYEDAHILIVNKPAGVLTQKAAPQDMSLNEWVVGYLLRQNPALREELDTFRPSVCNRLDRNTSGIVLCGKSLAGLQTLSKFIKERTIRKFYRTICVGEVKEAALVKGYLVKDAAKNKVTVTSHKPSVQEAEYIETRYEPLCAHGGYTLLEVELITGKTHQIRAHLASIGHPIIGDFKYGDKRVNQRLQTQFKLDSQLLHAFRIAFPATEDATALALSEKDVTAPCPAPFSRLQAAFGLQPD